MTNVERLADLLYPAEGPRTLDFKVSPGGRRSAEQLAGEILHAEEQIASGKARLVVDVDGSGSKQGPVVAG